MGGHATLADFGLIGPMYGHLGRDPWPAREQVASRPHLRAWIDRMAKRAALPYTLWMAQRVLDCLHALPAEEQASVAQWVREQGGARLLDLKLPRLRRAGLRVAVDS